MEAAHYVFKLIKLNVDMNCVIGTTRFVLNMRNISFENGFKLAGREAKHTSSSSECVGSKCMEFYPIFMTVLN
jgi:hypothetical protein